jgi:hypothetical protein
VRGLSAFGQRYGNASALEAVARASELLLARRLLSRRRDGQLIGPDWGGRVDRIHFPIQFYDVLFALEIMAEVGRIGDERCADAFRLLESKRLPDGGFPLEEANATRADKVVSRGSFTGWGPTGRRRGSPLVSLAGAREATAGVGSPEPEPGTYQALMRTGVIRTGTENSRAVSASSISQCASGAWYLAA